MLRHVIIFYKTPLPIMKAWYRPLLSVGAWTMFFYGFMLALFLLLSLKGVSAIVHPYSYVYFVFSGVSVFCLRHAITGHVRLVSKRTRQQRSLHSTVIYWSVISAIVIVFILLSLWLLLIVLTPFLIISTIIFIPV